ncbi:MAG: Hpt domain-containing protein [Lachnospiraceae bacterium]
MLKKLEEYGVNINEIMERFIDDVDLYKTCFVSFINDESFANLGKALEEKDYEKAFEFAHTLKGITGNMGFTPLYKILCHMVDALRQEQYTGLEDFYKEVMNQLCIIKELQE